MLTNWSLGGTTALRLGSRMLSFIGFSTLRMLSFKVCLALSQYMPNEYAIPDVGGQSHPACPNSIDVIPASYSMARILKIWGE